MKKLLTSIGFVVSWLTILTQGVLIIQHRVASVAETIVRFFSFFTILTNLLVALYFTAVLWKLKGGFFQLLQKNTSLTPITAFILIVGIIYQVILRAVWHPTGLQQIVDELLHTVIPLFVVAYWYLNTRNGELNHKFSIKWMLYPVLYIGLILIRGQYSNYYPYPFLNIPTLGFPTVGINILLIFGLMLAIMYGLAFLGKKITPHSAKSFNL